MAGTGVVIVIEGLPGSGKTTLCEQFNKLHPQVHILKEWVDTKILAEYLANPQAKAAEFQMRAQRETYTRFVRAVELAKQGGLVLLDRGFIGNRCFAELQFEIGWIDLESMTKYRQLCDSFKNIDTEGVRVKTLRLVCDIDVLMERIRKRNRNGESVYTEEYLTKLDRKHDELLIAENGVHLMP